MAFAISRIISRAWGHVALSVLIGIGLVSLIAPSCAFAATSVPFTINMNEAVTVTGTPRIAVDVGGVTRYATYTSGSGSASLVFTYAMVAGDVDLDGVSLSSPIDLNGGTITDLNGNPQTDLTFTVPNTSGVKIDYPSLSMDFIYDADGRYTLNGTAYNDLTSFLGASGGTFSRASIGTYFDSSGTLQTASSGTPRFDHDPVTHAPKGILIEEARTNLVTYSDMASTTGWGGSNQSFLTVNNPGSLPAGASNCLRDEIKTGQTNGFITQGLTLSLGTKYTYSVWMYVPSSVPAGKAIVTAWYNNAGWVGISSQIVTERDQWVHKTLTFTSNATYATHIVGSGLVGTTPGLQTYSCLAQLEAGAFATSYIPTTTAAVTRNEDSMTIPTGGWYNASAGSTAIDIAWITGTGTSYPMMWRFDDGTGDNRWNLFYNQATGRIGFDGFTGSVKQGAYYSLPLPFSGDIKASAALSLNNVNTAFDGVLLTTDTDWTPPPVTQFKLYASSASRTIKRFSYYPSRVSNTQLQLMTQ